MALQSVVLRAVSSTKYCKVVTSLPLPFLRSHKFHPARFLPMTKHPSQLSVVNRLETLKSHFSTSSLNMSQTNNQDFLLSEIFNVKGKVSRKLA